MFERFTDRARKTTLYAKQEAIKLNHEYIGTEHILLGLIKESSGVAHNVLSQLDCNIHKVYLEIEKIVQRGPDTEVTNPVWNPRSKKVFEYATDEAKRLNHNYVGTEHLLLGLIREQEGIAAQILLNFGLTLDQIRLEVLQLLGHPAINLHNIIDLVKRNAPAGLQQDEQDMEHWLETKLTLVYLTWKNPYVIISVNLETNIVAIKIPTEANLEKVEAQLNFARELRRNLEK